VAEPSPSDKRSENRAITDVAMEIYDMASHELVGIARLMNLSLTGACVETTSSLDGRDSLFVRMLLNGRLMAVPVKLMWERITPKVKEYGLRFGPYSDEMRDTVNDFIREHLEFYEETDLSLSPPPGAVPRN
jgi:hypothetical protein